jgi:hypothetical protein
MDRCGLGGLNRWTNRQTKKKITANLAAKSRGKLANDFLVTGLAIFSSMLLGRTIPHSLDFKN